MRLIDADALVHWLRNNVKNEDFYKKQFSAFQLRLLLENENTVDSEIVRCKDCKHCGMNRVLLKFLNICMLTDCTVSDNHFCAWGERK